jgi:hypothetical protein
MLEVPMNKTMLLLATVAAGSVALGCGNSKTDTSTSSGDLVVQGTVGRSLVTDPTTNTTQDGVRVFALGSDGRNVWTIIDKDRDFTLRLHVGVSYRIVVAQAVTAGPQQQVLGQLMLAGDQGQTPWLAAKSGGTVNLGTLKAATTAGAVKVQCECSGDDDDNSQGENDNNQGDDDDDDDGHNHSDDNGCHEGSASGSSSGSSGGGSSGSVSGSSGGGGSGHADDDDDDNAQGENDDDQGCLCGSGSSPALAPSKTPDGSVCGGGHGDHDDGASDRHSCGGS